MQFRAGRMERNAFNWFGCDRATGYKMFNTFSRDEFVAATKRRQTSILLLFSLENLKFECGLQCALGDGVFGMVQHSQIDVNERFSREQQKNNNKFCVNSFGWPIVSHRQQAFRTYCA